MRNLLLWSWALALSFLAAEARAELASLFGVGPVSSALGGTALLQGRPNAYQVFTAPAALGQIRQVEVSVGAQYLDPQLRPFGTVVINSAGKIGDFPTAGVLPGGGSLLAFALPIGRNRPLVLGGTIYLPFGTLLRVSSSPVDYPFYPLYTDISRNFFFVLGAGYEIADGWAVGVNVRSTTKSSTLYELRADNSVSYSASAVEARSRSRLSFSALYDHGRRHPAVERPFTVGAMYRARAGLENRIAANITSYVPVEGVLVSQPFFTPAEWVLMGSWRAAARWTLSADASWVKWSEYISPYGSGNINSYVIGDRQQAAGFRDIFVARVGSEFTQPRDGRWLRRLAYRGGYQFHPSPVPDQTGDSNFVDNDRHLFTLGLGLGYRNPWREEALIDVDFFFQYNWLKRREVRKSAATKVGAPGYVTGGKIFLYGAGATLRF